MGDDVTRGEPEDVLGDGEHAPDATHAQHQRRRHEAARSGGDDVRVGGDVDREELQQHAAGADLGLLELGEPHAVAGAFQCPCTHGPSLGAVSLVSSGRSSWYQWYP